MKPINMSLLVISVMVMGLGSSGVAFADKASVAIEAPESAAQGAEIPIKVTVNHEGNNFMHHVKLVSILINGKEAARWEFGWNSLPEAVPFTREITYKCSGTAEIKAEASCNIHGSKGPALKQVTVK